MSPVIWKTYIYPLRLRINPILLEGFFDLLSLNYVSFIGALTDPVIVFTCKLHVIYMYVVIAWLYGQGLCWAMSARG